MSTLTVSHATRCGKEKDVNKLWGIILEKVSFDGLFIILADEDKRAYNSGLDNYRVVLTNSERTRIVLVEMSFSHFAFAQVTENGVNVVELNYIKL